MAEHQRPLTECQPGPGPRCPGPVFLTGPGSVAGVSEGKTPSPVMSIKQTQIAVASLIPEVPFSHRIFTNRMGQGNGGSAKTRLCAGRVPEGPRALKDLGRSEQVHSQATAGPSGSGQVRGG